MSAEDKSETLSIVSSNRSTINISSDSTERMETPPIATSPTVTVSTGNGIENKGFVQDEKKNNGEFEAVNLELVDLNKPSSPLTEPRVYAPPSTPPPQKFSDYYVSVNEHKKGIRGEKLYVTKDSRRGRGCKRYCCALLVLLVIAATVTIASLVGTGVIDTQPQFKGEIHKSGRSRNLPPTNDSLIAGSPPVPVIDNDLDKVKESEILPRDAVPHVLEGQFSILNAAWDDRLTDPSDTFYKDFATKVESALLPIFVSPEKKDRADFFINVNDFERENGVTPHYRLGWELKDNSFSDGIELITKEEMSDMLKEHVKSNDGRLTTVFNVPTESIRVKRVADDQCSQMDCQSFCAYDYPSNKFRCGCSENFKLADDGKSCIEDSTDPTFDVNLLHGLDHTTDSSNNQDAVIIEGDEITTTLSGNPVTESIHSFNDKVPRLLDTSGVQVTDNGKDNETAHANGDHESESEWKNAGFPLLDSFEGSGANDNAVLEENDDDNSEHIVHSENQNVEHSDNHNVEHSENHNVEHSDNHNMEHSDNHNMEHSENQDADHSKNQNVDHSESFNDKTENTEGNIEIINAPTNDETTILISGSPDGDNEIDASTETNNNVVRIEDVEVPDNIKDNEPLNEDDHQPGGEWEHPGFPPLDDSNDHSENISFTEHDILDHSDNTDEGTAQSNDDTKADEQDNIGHNIVFPISDEATEIVTESESNTNKADDKDQEFSPHNEGQLDVKWETEDVKNSPESTEGSIQHNLSEGTNQKEEQPHDTTHVIAGDDLSNMWKNENIDDTNSPQKTTNQNPIIDSQDKTLDQENIDDVNVGSPSEKTLDSDNKNNSDKNIDSQDSGVISSDGAETSDKEENISAPETIKEDLDEHIEKVSLETNAGDKEQQLKDVKDNETPIDESDNSFDKNVVISEQPETSTQLNAHVDEAHENIVQDTTSSTFDKDNSIKTQQILSDIDPDTLSENEVNSHQVSEESNKDSIAEPELESDENPSKDSMHNHDSEDTQSKNVQVVSNTDNSEALSHNKDKKFDNSNSITNNNNESKNDNSEPLTTHNNDENKSNNSEEPLSDNKEDKTAIEGHFHGDVFHAGFHEDETFEDDEEEDILEDQKQPTESIDFKINNEPDLKIEEDESDNKDDFATKINSQPDSSDNEDVKIISENAPNTITVSSTEESTIPISENNGESLDEGTEEKEELEQELLVETNEDLTTESINQSDEVNNVQNFENDYTSNPITTTLKTGLIDQTTISNNVWTSVDDEEDIKAEDKIETKLNNVDNVPTTEESFINSDENEEQHLGSVNNFDHETTTHNVINEENKENVVPSDLKSSVSQFESKESKNDESDDEPSKDNTNAPGLVDIVLSSSDNNQNMSDDDKQIEGKDSSVISEETTFKSSRVETEPQSVNNLTDEDTESNDVNATSDESAIEDGIVLTKTFVKEDNVDSSNASEEHSEESKDNDTTNVKSIDQSTEKISDDIFRDIVHKFADGITNINFNSNFDDSFNNQQQEEVKEELAATKNEVKLPEEENHTEATSEDSPRSLDTTDILNKVGNIVIQSDNDKVETKSRIEGIGLDHSVKVESSNQTSGDQNLFSNGSVDPNLIQSIILNNVLKNNQSLPFHQDSQPYQVGLQYPNGTEAVFNFNGTSLDPSLLPSFFNGNITHEELNEFQGNETPLNVQSKPVLSNGLNQVIFGGFHLPNGTQIDLTSSVSPQHLQNTGGHFISTDGGEKQSHPQISESDLKKIIQSQLLGQKDGVFSQFNPLHLNESQIQQLVFSQIFGHNQSGSPVFPDEDQIKNIILEKVLSNRNNSSSTDPFPLNESEIKNLLLQQFLTQNGTLPNEEEISKLVLSKILSSNGENSTLSFPIENFSLNETEIQRLVLNQILSSGISPNKTSNSFNLTTFTNESLANRDEELNILKEIVFNQSGVESTTEKDMGNITEIHSKNPKQGEEFTILSGADFSSQILGRSNKQGRKINDLFDEECKDSENEFKCIGPGGCLPKSLRCNGVYDCRDGSDELLCEENGYEKDECIEFQCPNGPCIPTDRVCDGQVDCLDSFDELNCDQSSLNCTVDEFYCVKDARCIPMSYRCDGTPDCVRGNEDEENCECDPETEFKCLIGGGCIDKINVCDGFEDCADLSDEFNCLQTTTEGEIRIRDDSDSWSALCFNNDSSGELAQTACQQMGYRFATIEEDAFVDSPMYKTLSFPTSFKNGLRVDNKILENTTNCDNNPKVTCKNIECSKRKLTDAQKEALKTQGTINVTSLTLDNELWPSLAYLFNVNRKATCVVTILRPTWLITSHSCMAERSMDPKEWVAFADPANGPSDEARIQIRTVKRIISHPLVKFKQGYYTNDLALIELDETLTLNEFVQPSCLGQFSKEKDFCFVAGWTDVNKKGVSFRQYLDWISLPMMPFEECNSQNHYNKLLNKNSLCTSSKHSDVPCRADGGAPLFCYQEDGWRLQGVLSKEGECLNSSHPDLFTSIEGSESWIGNLIGNEGL